MTASNTPLTFQDMSYQQLYDWYQENKKQFDSLPTETIAQFRAAMNKREEEWKQKVMDRIHARQEGEIVLVALKEEE